MKAKCPINELCKPGTKPTVRCFKAYIQEFTKQSDLFLK